MDPVTIVAIIVTAVASVVSYTAQGVTNAKLKANNRNQIFLSIYGNR